MKEHSREGERRREMGCAAPQPPREGGCAPLEPPLHFKRGTRESLTVAVDPSLIRKADLQYGFETRARRVNRGDRCLPTRRGLGSRRCLPTRRGLGSRRLRDNGGVRRSRLDGSNAQVQDSGEEAVAEPLRKGERRKAMGGPRKTLCLKQRRNEGAFERR